MTFEGLGKSMTAGLVAAILLGIIPAQAADLGRSASPVYEAEPDRVPIRSIWDGVYYGASVGYGWGESDHFYDRNDNHGIATQERLCVGCRDLPIHLCDYQSRTNPCWHPEQSSS